MDESFWKVAEPLLVAAIQVLLPFLMVYAGVALRAGVAWIKANTAAKHLAVAELLAKQFVLACEQQNLSGILKLVGAEKKEWVRQRVQEELDRRKIPLDARMLSDLIEGVLLENVNLFKLYEEDVPQPEAPPDPAI